MLRKMAYLGIISLLSFAVFSVAAQTSSSPKSATNAEADEVIASQKIQSEIAKGLRPPTMDPLITNDDMPQNIVKILRTSNKAQINTYVPFAYTFEHNNPYNVIGLLRRIVQVEDGVLFTFVNDEGDGGKVLFAVPSHLKDSLAELVKYLDRPGLTTSSGALNELRQLKHRSSLDINFLDFVNSQLTGEGSKLFVDPIINAIFWEDAPSGTIDVRDMFDEMMDIPTPMVEVTVKIYEVDVSNDAAMGLDYMAWKNGPGRYLFDGIAGAFSESTGRDLPHQSIRGNGWAYAYNYTVPSEFFDFLVVKGKARILNSTKLAMMSGTPARLVAGDQLLYYATNVDDENGRTVVGTTNVEDEHGDLVPLNTGLDLTIFPIIGQLSDRLGITLEWSDYSFPDDTGVPQINTRRLETGFGVTVGTEFMIGGLTRQVTARATRKVPILGSIPILGWAFGGESVQTRKTEMVVAITANNIVNYDVAKDFRIAKEDQTVIDMATGRTMFKEPKMRFGFEQPIFDSEFGQVPPADPSLAAQPAPVEPEPVTPEILSAQ